MCRPRLMWALPRGLHTSRITGNGALYMLARHQQPSSAASESVFPMLCRGPGNLCCVVVMCGGSRLGWPGNSDRVCSLGRALHHPSCTPHQSFQLPTSVQTWGLDADRGAILHAFYVIASQSLIIPSTSRTFMFHFYAMDAKVHN